MTASKILPLIIATLTSGLGVSASEAIHSFDTGLTIIHVRSAVLEDRPVIVGASYEGTITAHKFDGKPLWPKPNPLTGSMVRDLWCGDLDRDGNDEVLAALSDGSVHCLNLSDGSARWKQPFQPNEVPMNAICTVRGPDSTYVACGGFDKNLYYLAADGQLLKTIESATYSVQSPWGAAHHYLGRPVGKAHVANFLRPLPQPDGTDHLLVLGMHNHMQAPDSIYEFEPLATTPVKKAQQAPLSPSGGCFKVVDPTGDGNFQLLFGTSSLGKEAMFRMDASDGESKELPLRKIGPNGYRVVQCEVVPEKNGFRYFILGGDHAILAPPDLDPKKLERIDGPYAFHDLWRDPVTGRLLLASAQSGGSAIHVLNPADPAWKQSFAELKPPGKMTTMRKNFRSVREQLAGFERPAHERAPDDVLFSAASPKHSVAEAQIKAGHDHLKFFHNRRTVPWNHTEKEGWQEKYAAYRNSPALMAKNDTRMKPVLTREESVDSFMPGFEHPDSAGVSIWAGHGNDLFFFQPDTLRDLMRRSDGKYTLLTFPEVGGHVPNIDEVMEEIIYPLAEFASDHKGRIILRNKNTYFQTAVHLPYWKRLISGEFRDVFISSMEETTDKTQDMSLAGRIGLWASGCMDIWGMRTSRDNPSFDRSRQHSYQRVTNHFLRNVVHSLAYGARYTQNTYTDPDTMSLIWELVGSGALYIPRRDEIVSFNPVHFGVTDPDERYMEESENHKFCINYDAAEEAANPMVFSRMNATWMAAKPTAWDYSTIAHGAKERRLDFIPTFEKGLVLITPVENGVHASPASHRKRLAENLHPLYRNILTEHVTDGRDYLDPKGDKRFPANSDYYKRVERQIDEGARKLPLTVTGSAWVCAQTAPDRLRLTLVDNGYLNPAQRTATVHFQTVTPRIVTDVLSGERIEVVDDKAEIIVPLGMFRFIDVQLTEEFRP